MIILLSELQKNHLTTLVDKPISVFSSLCRHAVEFLTCGDLNEKVEAVSGKIGVPTDDVMNFIHALVYLLVESSKHRISENDFKSSLAIAGLNEDQQNVLVNVYNVNQDEFSECLHLLQQQDPEFQDLSWRFEVQVASRNNDQELIPNVALDLVLREPKNYNKCSQTNETSDVDFIEINNSIEDAKSGKECTHKIKHVPLACDLPNLVNMINKLEQALKESKSQHVRKVQRALQ